jgi:hypothetical protein
MMTRKLAIRAASLALMGMMAVGSRAAEGEQQPGQDLDPAAMAKMLEEFAAPGPEHANLEHMVGRWKAECKSFWPNPDEPTVTHGTAEFTMLLGGRYLLQEFKGEFDGKPFEGMGVHAYDKAKKKYVSGWIDSMSTGIMLSEGDYNEATSTLTETGEAATPWGKCKSRSTYHIVDDDTVVLTMYMTMPGTAETKSMEVTYRRER